jgi:hypothetical protein
MTDASQINLKVLTTNILIGHFTNTALVPPKLSRSPLPALLNPTLDVKIALNIAVTLTALGVFLYVMRSP